MRLNCVCSACSGTVREQVYCSGNNNDLGGSHVSISGGTFSNNEASEVGGAVVAWGAPTVVNVTGGLFANNTAR